MGQWIHIPAGNGIKQQQFQHIHVRKRVQTALGKLRLEPCAVSVMDAHFLPSFLKSYFSTSLR